MILFLGLMILRINEEFEICEMTMRASRRLNQITFINLLLKLLCSKRGQVHRREQVGLFLVSLKLLVPRGEEKTWINYKKLNCKNY